VSDPAYLLKVARGAYSSSVAAAQRAAREINMTQTKHSTIALVTGGSRGLGKNMVLSLAERGVDVIFTYRSAEAEADAVVAEVERLGRKALKLHLDVGESATFAAFTERLSGALRLSFGRERFDYLINNAGMGLHAPFMETTEAQFDELMRVHLKGTFFLTQRLLPLMADGGRILNISSGLARVSFPGASAYAAMKGAVEVLTRYLAKELGPRKITVNTLAPGAIETDFGGGRVRDNPELNRAIAAQTALGRVGLPDDIGGAAWALLAPESGWINGQRVEASGGMLL
jgi:NAD(P)-dependent dehydrogenase (short-subunit alcohol dehydrogenase family)